MFCCRPRTDYVVAASSSQSLLTHSRTLSPKNSFHVARHPVNQSQRRGLAIMEITIRKPFENEHTQHGRRKQFYNKSSPSPQPIGCDNLLSLKFLPVPNSRLSWLFNS